jgi:hypothetical protein
MRCTTRLAASRTWGWPSRVLALLLAGALLAACAGRGAEREAGTEGTSVADILADPARYQGQQLTLSGEVSNALSSRVFRIEESDGPLNTNSDNDGLLVVIAEEAERPPDVDGEMRVRVTGELRAYDSDTLDPDIGTSFVPAVEGISEGDPMLLAKRVLVQATIGALDANPGAYLHNVVTVSGRVEEVLRQGIVRLEDPEAGGDVLVVLGDAEPDSLAQEGRRLVVTGQVRQFNLEELGGELELDLDSGIFAGWENRLVIMAESIQEG